MYSYETRVRYSEVNETRDATLLSIINWFQECCTFEAEDRGVGVDWQHSCANMIIFVWNNHVNPVQISRDLRNPFPFRFIDRIGKNT